MARQKKAPPEEIMLDRERALEEAAMALSRAAEHADRKEDIDNLLQVAAGWMELSTRFEHGTSSRDDEQKRSPIGFVDPETIEVVTKGPGEIVEGES